MDLGLGVVRRDQLGEGETTGIKGDRIGFVIEDEAIVNVWLGSSQRERDVGAFGDFGRVEGGGTTGGDAAFVDGEVAVCCEGYDGAFNGRASG